MPPNEDPKLSLKAMILPGRKLGSILDADQNSFNLVRLAAALAVLISHSFSINSGLNAPEPLQGTTPFTLGGHAVNAFFVVSGLTLSHSIERNPSLLHYTAARILRLFPGLFVFGCIFAFVAGPILTNLTIAEYFNDAHTWMYPFAVMFQFSQAVPPHEIFMNAVFAGAVNSPLWTIKYEIMNYFALALLVRLGVFDRLPLLVLAVCSSIAIMFVANASSTEPGSTWLFQVGRYGVCFMLGVMAYQFRDVVDLSPLFLLLTIALTVLLSTSIVREQIFIVLVAHAVMVIGGIDFGRLTRFSRTNDISYGTYIYGWPIQQSIIQFCPGIGIALLAVSSVLIVPLAGLASWAFVERPALRLKRWLPKSLPDVARVSP